ncbi:MAG: type IV pilus secretin PilQ, partial [Bdellovibrionota bacterium]
DLNAQLALAQTDSMVRIISSPRIVTMNKQQAEILQKGEVITVNSTVDTGGNTSSTAIRTPVQLKLNVTPQVTNEGSVLLDVDVLREFAGAVVDTATKARPVNSRSAKTKVMVPNGQTAVIGGIYQNDEQSGESGIPGLKDIPVFGWLFKSKNETREKNELIIFLTPRILNAKDQVVTQ